MAKKFRVGLALQPLATALFANSPFTEGKPNGFLSLPQPHLVRHRPAPHRHAAVRVRGRLRLRALRRLHARRADVLRVPRRQVHRRRRAELPRFPRRQAARAARRAADARATGSTTSRPPSPKCGSSRFLEMRGADGGPWNRICALPALWVGLLYDDAALDAAWDLVKHWSMDEREALRNAVPRLALDAPLPGGGKLLDLAREVLADRPRRASSRAPGSTRAATARPASSSRSRRSSPAARSRRSACSTSSTANGAATSAGSTKRASR